MVQLVCMPTGSLVCFCCKAEIFFCHLPESSRASCALSGAAKSDPAGGSSTSSFLLAGAHASANSPINYRRALVLNPASNPARHTSLDAFLRRSLSFVKLTRSFEDRQSIDHTASVLSDEPLWSGALAKWQNGTVHNIVRHCHSKYFLGLSMQQTSSQDAVVSRQKGTITQLLAATTLP